MFWLLVTIPHEMCCRNLGGRRGLSPESLARRCETPEDTNWGLRTRSSWRRICETGMVLSQWFLSHFSWHLRGHCAIVDKQRQQQTLGKENGCWEQLSWSCLMLGFEAAAFADVAHEDAQALYKGWGESEIVLGNSTVQTLQNLVLVNLIVHDFQ